MGAPAASGRMQGDGYPARGGACREATAPAHSASPVSNSES